MEAVRSDWTALAKQVQRELYQRLFTDQPVDAYLADVVQRGAERRAGRHARLSQEPAQACAGVHRDDATARRCGKQVDAAGGPLHQLRHDDCGPEPTDNIQHPLDREHYVAKQVKPVAEPVLATLGLDFEVVIGDGRQLTMF